MQPSQNFTFKTFYNFKFLGEHFVTQNCQFFHTQNIFQEKNFYLLEGQIFFKHKKPIVKKPLKMKRNAVSKIFLDIISSLKNDFFLKVRYRCTPLVLTNPLSLHTITVGKMWGRRQQRNAHGKIYKVQI
jgi:hypothetical protein